MTGSPLRRPIQSSKRDLHLPIVLYIPNLLCYLRIGLSFYVLHIYVQSLAPSTSSSGPKTEWVVPLLGTILELGTSSRAWRWLASSPPPSSSSSSPSSSWGVFMRGEGTHAAAGGDASLRLWVLAVYAVAMLLDVLDGYAARKLNQASRLGALLDVLADNILRSSMWLASALTCPRHALLPALAFISIEWTTLLATQLSVQADGGRYWKSCRAKDPPFITAFFSNNFRNPLGGLGIAGLFVCPIAPFVASTLPPSLLNQVPWLWAAVACLLFVGRLLSLLCELHFLREWFTSLISDSDDRHHD